MSTQERPRAHLIDDYVLTAMFAKMAGNVNGSVSFLDRAIELCRELSDPRLESLTTLRDDQTRAA